MKINNTTTPFLVADNSKRNWTIGVSTIAMFVFYGIPKLTGDPRSVAGFDQFSPVLGLNSDTFRLFTGGTEIGIAIILVASLMIASRRKIFSAMAYLLTFATMTSGLLIEFFVRVQPAKPLVAVAIVFAALALFQLKATLGSLRSESRFSNPALS